MSDTDVFKKKYAIVRVDDKCPYIVEDFDSTKINNMFKCYDICKKFKNGSCKTVCRYGDTKEQLINKITTALRRTWLNEDNQSFQEVAEEIVEFLGVEE